MGFEPNSTFAWGVNVRLQLSYVLQWHSCWTFMKHWVISNFRSIISWNDFYFFNTNMHFKSKDWTQLINKLHLMMNCLENFKFVQTFYLKKYMHVISVKKKKKCSMLFVINFNVNVMDMTLWERLTCKHDCNWISCSFQHQRP